jgi:Tfp pilus assembly protein PilO
MKPINLLTLISDKNKIINAIIILVTLPIAVNIYKFQTRNIDALNMQKDIEIKKNEILEKIGQSEKKINAYKELLNKKDISLIVNTISNIAKNSGIEVISIKPVNREDLSVYSRYSFALTINADSYHLIGGFISSLESCPDVYFIDRITINVIERDQKTEKLGADLVLSTILFKN